MTNKKDQLKSLFATGEIPFGEHFAEFIDESYNTYKIVDMFDPNQAPKDFEQGVSVLVFNFDPIDNPDWDVLFGGNVPAGDIMVRTLKYDGAGVIIQEFDTKRNGLYFPDKSRIAVDDDTWGPMNEHKQVISVNGNLPDDNGNITVSGGGNVIVEDALNSDSEVNALSASKGKFLFEEINFVSDELTTHADKKASYDDYGHVKVDGSTIYATNGVIRTSVPTDANFVYYSSAQGTHQPSTSMNSYKGGININNFFQDNPAHPAKAAWLEAARTASGLTLPQATTGIQVITESAFSFGTQTLTAFDMSTAAGTRGTVLFKARRMFHDSAWQNWKVEIIKSDLDNHANLKATTSTLGHVKVDGTTITVTDGVIGVPDATTSTKGVVQLDSTVNSETNKAITPNAVNTAFTTHNNVLATKTQRGHVQIGDNIEITNPAIISVPTATTAKKGVVSVDGTTINVNSSGVISTPTKKYMQAYNSAVQQITAPNQVIKFEQATHSEFSYSTSAGTFTLLAGKTYRITVNSVFEFTTGSYVELGLYNETASSYVSSAFAFWYKQGAFSEIAVGPLECVITPTVNTTYSIKAKAMDTTSLIKTKIGLSRLIIQEL